MEKNPGYPPAGNQTCISVGPDLYWPAQHSHQRFAISATTARQRESQEREGTFGLYECWPGWVLGVMTNLSLCVTV